MPTDDLDGFCCQNPDCPDHGRRGAGNLSVCGHYGQAHHRRRRASRGPGFRGNSNASWDQPDKAISQVAGSHVGYPG